MFPEWKCEWKCECECGSEIPLSESKVVPTLVPGARCVVRGANPGNLTLGKGDRGNSSVYVSNLGALEQLQWEEHKLYSPNRWGY